MKIYESKGGNRNMLSMLRKKIVAGLLIIAMAFSVIVAPVNTEAAAKPKLSYVKTAKVGKATSITIKNVKKGYYYKITKTTGSVTTTPKVKKATKIYGKTATIKAVSKKPGTYKVTIQVYKNKKAKTKVGKAITATVKVVDNTQIELEGASVWVGETTNVKFTVTPSTTKVTFRSENPDIVTIDEEGNVTGVKAGTAVIVATAGQKEARAEVKVGDTTALELESTRVFIGKTTKLKSTVAPEIAKVTFKSENPEVATVDCEGNVTGVATGETTIVATSGSKTATTKVIVEQEVIPDKETEATDITLNPEKVVVFVGGEAKVEATAIPATAKIVLRSENPEIVTVDEEGNVTGVAAGETTIIATSGSKTATTKVIVEQEAIPDKEADITNSMGESEGADVFVDG